MTRERVDLELELRVLEVRSAGGRVTMRASRLHVQLRPELRGVVEPGDVELARERSQQLAKASSSGPIPKCPACGRWGYHLKRCRAAKGGA